MDEINYFAFRDMEAVTDIVVKFHVSHSIQQVIRSGCPVEGFGSANLNAAIMNFVDQADV